MKIKLRKVGNSTGLIIPSSILKLLDIKDGDSVSVSVQEGKLIVSPEKGSPDTIESFNSAINYAKNVGSEREALFLKLWRERDLETIRKEFPDFSWYFGEQPTKSL